MSARCASVSTFSTTVGAPPTPRSYGRGGVNVGSAGPPFRNWTSAVSSPATKRSGTTAVCTLMPPSRRRSASACASAPRTRRGRRDRRPASRRPRARRARRRRGRDAARTRAAPCPCPTAARLRCRSRRRSGVCSRRAPSRASRRSETPRRHGRSSPTGDALAQLGRRELERERAVPLDGAPRARPGVRRCARRRAGAARSARRCVRATLIGASSACRGRCPSRRPWPSRPEDRRGATSVLDWPLSDERDARAVEPDDLADVRVGVRRGSVARAARGHGDAAAVDRLALKPDPEHAGVARRSSCRRC